MIALLFEEEFFLHLEIAFMTCIYFFSVDYKYIREVFNAIIEMPWLVTIAINNIICINNISLQYHKTCKKMKMAQRLYITD